MIRPLIIGYGNTLREDDGIGWRAAELVAQNLGKHAVDLLQVQQLTPELETPVKNASIVIFLDAALDLAPGSVSAARVEKGDSSAWSHRLTPSQLLNFVEGLVPGYWIRGGAQATGWREGLTATGEQSAAAMAGEAIRLLQRSSSGNTLPGAFEATRTRHRAQPR